MPILTAEERVGTVLGGRYSLESILGTGGTSVVYAATHTFTKRKVALKILKPEHAKNRELVGRFLREARVASTLVHPNVVAILDMGTEDGDTYLAMELLSGEALSEILNREGPLTPERTLALLRPVMEAIAIAHTQGIVHRDLKPDNIVVGDRGDGTTRAILLDFGMAKTNEAAWGHMTQSGILVGTPFYMSPEQAEGASDIDAATDVWAMGVTLYRCLCGTLPFFTTSPSALLLAIARGDHVPLGERSPDLPAPITAWVEGALVGDRTKRYRDMGEMLAALDRALAGEIAPSHVAPTPEPEPEPETAAEPLPVRGRGPLVIALGVAALVTLALVASRFVAADPPRDAPAIAPTTVAVTPPASVMVPPPPETTTSVAVAPPPTTTVEDDPPAPPSHTGGHRRTRTTTTTTTTTTTPPPETTTTRSHSGLASEW